jgi:hypothetical protein
MHDLRGWSVQAGVAWGTFSWHALAALGFATVLGGAGDLLDADDPERGVEEIVTFLRRGLGAG